MMTFARQRDTKNFHVYKEVGGAGINKVYVPKKDDGITPPDQLIVVDPQAVGALVNA